MAHAARVNDIAKKLVVSITGNRSDDESFKQVLKDKTKQLRTSGHGRTNQFDVQSKFDGSVEKCIILNREDLAGALQMRLDELPVKSKWLPETLSLLLSLSDRPVDKTDLQDLERIAGEREEENVLTWDDIFAGRPADEIGLWEDIERGYHSSGDETTAEDDDVTISTKATSVDYEDLESLARLHLVPVDEHALDEVRKAHSHVHGDPGHVSLSELTIIRESLMMLQDLPSNVYELDSTTGEVYVNKRFSVTTTSPAVLHDLLNSFASVGTSLHYLRTWSRAEEGILYLQSCQASIQGLLRDFALQLATIDEKFVSPKSKVVVSIIKLRSEIDFSARPLVYLSKLLQRSKEQSKASPFAVLDSLYERICTAELADDTRLAITFAHVFFAGLRTYLKPVSAWIRNGSLVDHYQTFFVVEAKQECELGRIWHDRYSMCMLADGRPFAPAFLQNLTGRIFSMGKSRAFLAALLRGSEDLDEPVMNALPDFASLISQMESVRLMTFSQSLNEELETWIVGIGEDCTPLLCRSLLYDHGLLNTINRLVKVFGSEDGRRFQNFADALFWRMDAGKSWEDAFLLTELAQSTLGSESHVDAETLAIFLHKEHDWQTNPSIAQLADLELRMLHSWPIQNITCSPSPQSYSRAFSFLLQVYRAKYLLRGQVNGLRAVDSRTKGLTQSFNFVLRLRHSFAVVVDLLHHHICSTLAVLSATLRKDMESAEDIDAMSAIWMQHEKQIESNLLLSSNLKPLRDAVTDVLQLCEQSCREWTRSLAVTDVRGNRLNGLEAEQSLDDTNVDDLSVHSRMLILNRDLEKSLSFIVAGLRATSRASGNTFLEALGDRLEWRANG